ncbi:helix-turn-helix domain-containing protein [Streptomyces sp. NPDC093991]|uniref:TetR/AcrR family transcriptional regulator n=1 Tax=unclassified Streptomyces TaxID=2593676 RepID=UPI00342334DF
MTVGEEPTALGPGPTGPEAAASVPPRLRRDARRNRERLVEAAHAVFAEQGLEAPLDVIARRAGVGNATLYRHFPTRAALVDAVFRDQLTETMEAGERARGALDPWTGLTGYLDAVFVTLAADRGTNDLMTTRLPDAETLGAVHAHNRETVGVLLERARAEGSVRADVTTEDLLFALAALGRAVPPLAVAAGPDAWRRPLALFLEGLRGPASEPRPLPGTPLGEEELGQVLGEMGPHRARPADGSAAGDEA